MKKLKVAIIGCGRIATKHINAISKNNELLELISVCDIKINKAIEKSELYYDLTGKKINVYTDYNKMFLEEKIDLVSICSESGNHFKHAYDTLNFGLSVLVEKPFTMDEKDGLKLIKIANEKDLFVSVVHQNRFNEPIKLLKDSVKNGYFGKIINITARILWNRNDDYYLEAPWRGTKKMDGGTLMNQCIHNIDLLIWLADSEVINVKSERGTYLRNIEMEDFGAALVRFKNGIIGIIEGSACVYPSNLEETLSVFGSTGTAVIGGKAVNKIDNWDVLNKKIEKPVNELIDSVYGNGHIKLYENVAKHILYDEVLIVKADDGVKAVKLVNQIYLNSKLYPVNSK